MSPLTRQQQAQMTDTCHTFTTSTELTAPTPQPPPWTWVQPAGTNALLDRLRIARDEAVPERERENLCSCAMTEITRLLGLIDKRDSSLGKFGETLANQRRRLSVEADDLLAELKRAQEAALEKFGRLRGIIDRLSKVTR